MPESETPAPQNPEPQQPQGESKLDWRLVVIVGMAVLFLIAVYVNKKWYSKPAAEPAPAPESVAKEAPSPSAPPESPTERYAKMLRVREMEIHGEMFSVGGRIFLVAMPAMPSSTRENSKEPDSVTPGVLFDITKRAEGVRPEMFQRRTIFGADQALFMDMFPPLGTDGRIEMVIRPAGSVTMDMLADNQPVVGVKVGTEARAYPVKLMDYHDVINDTLGGQQIVVVWSAVASAPSAMVRERMPRLDLTPLAEPDASAAQLAELYPALDWAKTFAPVAPTFGTAGLVYQGAIVMYSKDNVLTADGKKVEEYSLWSPTLRLCLAGDRAGARLRPIQADLVSWQTWKTLHPDTTVLTGTRPVLPFNYDANMAAPPDYLNPQNPTLPHPVYGLDAEKNPLFPKARVFGITDTQGKAAKAYLVGLLREKNGPFEDTVGDRKLTLQYNPETLMLSAKDAEGKPVLTEAMLWIAWLGAHPNTEVWQEQRLRELRARQATAAPGETPAPTTAPQSKNTSE